MQKFIERITKYMKENDLSHAQFAQMIGASEYRLKNWLNNKSKPRGNHLYDICKATGLSCDYLVGLKD